MSAVTRRWLIRSAAAGVALPFLPSLLSGARADDAPPRRFLFWYAPNGQRMAHWVPDKVGANYDLKPILEPLAPVQSDVSVLTGLANRPAQVPVAGDHARGTGSFLTCRTVVKTAGADIQNGVSIDQVLAGKIGSETTLPSLELGVEGGASVGVCDSGYSCAYVRNVSWAGAATPLPKMNDPRLVFDRLFSGFDPTLTEAERAKRRALRSSVLDVALEDAAALQSKLSVSDRYKLDEYLTGVRALETRLQEGDELACVPPEIPGSNLDYPSTVAAMTQLMVMALKCDLTRVVTFMLGNGGSNRTYEFAGVSGAHHELSHHQDNPETLDKLTTIGRWEVEQFAALVAALGAEEEFDGSRLLDNTLAYFSSEISDGNRHNHDDLPVLLAGGGGGLHAPGRHLVWEETPMANLFTAFMGGVGLPENPFGDDGTGPLDGLL